jgi:TRAP-type C4-dicarboxylate transport system permease small subunit
MMSDACRCAHRLVIDVVVVSFGIFNIWVTWVVTQSSMGVPRSMAADILAYFRVFDSVRGFRGRGSGVGRMHGFW